MALYILNLAQAVVPLLLLVLILVLRGSKGIQKFECACRCRAIGRIIGLVFVWGYIGVGGASSEKCRHRLAAALCEKGADATRVGESKMDERQVQYAMRWAERSGCFQTMDQIQEFHALLRM